MYQVRKFHIYDTRNSLKNLEYDQTFHIRNILMINIKIKNSQKYLNFQMEFQKNIPNSD